jgi:hypothetical protein
MSFEKAMNKMKYDIRLLEYNFARGFISQDEYNKYLSQLEDSAHLVAPPVSELEATVEDVLDEENH